MVMDIYLFSISLIFSFLFPCHMYDLAIYLLVLKVSAK